VSLCLCGVIPLGLATPARAETELTRVFPNGAQRGTRVMLTFGGTGLPDPATLMVEGEGIRAAGPFVKGAGEIEVAADAKPGVRQLRLVGAKGATPPRPFAIGTLPEVLEKEPNSDPEHAERLERLPILVNGTLPNRPDLDLFRIPLKKGECLVVAGEARTLGAPTNLLVRIRNAAGTELAVQMDYRTRDPLLGFTVPADGDYVVELQDVMNNYSNVNEDYVYRVVFTKGPWLDRAWPAGAERGKPAHLQLLGWNLNGVPGPGKAEADVAIPADAAARYPVSGAGAPNAVIVATGPAPEVLEEKSGLEGPPQPLAPPVSVSGVLAARNEVDRYQFAAKKDEVFAIDVDSREMGSFADPALTLLDSAGKVLTTVDDLGRGERDPRLFWTAPADGVYRIRLRDIAGGARAGNDYFYRLTVAPPAPDLRLSMTGLPDGPTLLLKPGGKLEVSISVTQSYQEAPVTLVVEGLPAGVTAAPVTVPAGGKRTSTSSVKITLTAAADAAVGANPVRIVARTEGGLSAIATATWVLAKDRSGTLVTGSTAVFALVITAPEAAAAR
jgi:hypothetical protein